MAKANNIETVEVGRFWRQPVEADLSVGLTLRAAREATKQTLQFYSRRLNIPVRYLRALEEESLLDLPGLVYEKHFLARYAEVFHLDVEALVAQWIAMREANEKPLAKFVPRVHKFDLWISPWLGRKVVVTALFVMLGSYVGLNLWQLIEPPELTVAAPTPDQVVSGTQIFVIGQSTASAIVKVNGQVVSTTDGHFSVPLVLDSGANVIKVAAERRFGRPTILERRVFAANEKALSQAGSSFVAVVP